MTHSILDMGIDVYEVIFMKDTILVIDDNQVNQQVFLEALGHAWNILVSKGMDEAFALINQGGINLIILDVLFEGGTAFDFIAHLSETEGGLDIPVVYVTSMEERHEMHKAMKLGGSDYIFKPLDIQEIQMTIRNQMKLQAL